MMHQLFLVHYSFVSEHFLVRVREPTSFPWRLTYIHIGEALGTRLYENEAENILFTIEEK